MLDWGRGVLKIDLINDVNKIALDQISAKRGLALSSQIVGNAKKMMV